MFAIFSQFAIVDLPENLSSICYLKFLEGIYNNTYEHSYNKFYRDSQTKLLRFLNTNLIYDKYSIGLAILNDDIAMISDILSFYKFAEIQILEQFCKIICLKGSLDMFKLIHKYSVGTFIDVGNYMEYVFYAVKSHNIELAKYINELYNAEYIENELDLYSYELDDDCYIGMIYEYCVRYGDCDLFKTMHKYFLYNDIKNSLLNIAISHNNLEMIKVLLDLGLQLEYKQTEYLRYELDDIFEAMKGSFSTTVYLYNCLNYLPSDLLKYAVKSNNIAYVCNVLELAKKEKIYIGRLNPFINYETNSWMDIYVLSEWLYMEIEGLTEEYYSQYKRLRRLKNRK